MSDEQKRYACPYALRIPAPGSGNRYITLPCNKAAMHSDGPHQAVIEGAKTERSLTSGLGATLATVQWTHDL